MELRMRPLILEIYDLAGQKVCPLYDSSSDISGQAYNVFINTERNGYRELTFSLPSVCSTEDGFEKNFRLDFLKADYRIRSNEAGTLDWFIVSEPKIAHNGYTKTVSVTAVHISQMLKYKNLNLEFSDADGNNTGTAEAILETILSGTGWKVGYVADFYEKGTKTIKVRSLTASTKTGAFKLISKLCDLFDAKPIYHGNEKTVDLVPLNPFEEPEDGALPDIAADGVLQLHYGKNIKILSRSLDTENMITRLYAYGSYGDDTSGYCGIDEVEHTQITFTLTDSVVAGQKYYFITRDDSDTEITRSFTAKKDAEEGSTFIYSFFDPASLSYIWDESNEYAYQLGKERVGKLLPATEGRQKIKNWLTSVMDFHYYQDSDMFTDDMLQAVSTYQRKSIADYQAIYKASGVYSDKLTQLAKTVGSINYCKLDVKTIDETDNYVKLILNTDKYEDGIIYRTDYLEKKNKRFKIIPATKLIDNPSNPFDGNGDPINTATAVLYIIHNTEPLTWDKVYLRDSNDADHPTELTLEMRPNSTTFSLSDDKFYLFEYNGINGLLGSFESMDESAERSLTSTTTIGATEHPVVFADTNRPESYPVPTQVAREYGWLWNYHKNGNPSSFYFCYGKQKDIHWYKVHFSDVQPEWSAGDYWYNWRDGTLSRVNPTTGVKVDYSTQADKRVVRDFSSVYALCKMRDRYHHGVFDNYVYAPDQAIAQEHFYIDIGYGIYWVFTANEQVRGSEKFILSTTDNWVTHERNDGSKESLKAKAYRFDSVKHHPSNVYEQRHMESGTIDYNGSPVSDEKDSASKHWRSSSFLSVYPNIEYKIITQNQSPVIFLYDQNKTYITNVKPNTDGTFMTNSIDGAFPAYYIKVVFDVTEKGYNTNNNQIYATCIENKSVETIIINDTTYYKLNPVYGMNDNGKTEADGATVTKGIVPQLKLFKDLTDEAYLVDYPAFRAEQKKVQDLEMSMMEALGDIYKEGYWQKDSYVNGDEQKLYDDAVDNLQKLSKPEAKYSLSFLDLYGANINDSEFGISIVSAETEWPDVDISMAAHLIDPQIDVNCWAYIDKIKKCYDQPSKTSIEINTNLTTMSQHSLVDVMSNIAEVAASAKGIANNASGTVAIIGDRTISGSQITNGSISTEKISNLDDVVNSLIDTKLKGLVIGSDQIDRATIGYAQIDDAAINYLSAAAARIAVANIDLATIDDASIKNAIIGQLTANLAWIEDASIDVAKIKDLSAIQIDVSQINGTLIPPGTINVDKLAQDALSKFATHYLDHVPTNATEPTVQWTNNAKKDYHAGDVALYHHNGINEVYKYVRLYDDPNDSTKVTGYAWQKQGSDTSLGKLGDMLYQMQQTQQTQAENSAKTATAEYLKSDEGYQAIMTAKDKDGTTFGSKVSQSAKEATIDFIKTDEQTQKDLADSMANTVATSISANADGVKVIADKIDLKAKVEANSLTAAQVIAGLLTSDDADIKNVWAEKITADMIKVDDLVANEVFTNSISSKIGSLDLTSNESIKEYISRQSTFENDTKKQIDDLIGYRVNVESTSDVLSSSTSTVRLTATVWHGSLNVTDTFKPENFVWKRQSSDAVSDKAWVPSYYNGKHNIITVEKDQVNEKAVYICQIEIEDEEEVE